ncbi:NodA family N-acyltransferase [Bradyrhizobium sp. TZ2]
MSDFFRNTYGPTGACNARPFEGSRSWAGARPEVRAIGYDAHGVAAHIGALRRFIKVGGVDLLVAELGLYGVRPDLEGTRNQPFNARDVSGTAGAWCSIRLRHGPARAPETSYKIARPRGLATVVSGVRVRSTVPDVNTEFPPVRVEDVLIVVFPIAQPMSDWPTGTTIDRNGPEL